MSHLDATTGLLEIARQTLRETVMPHVGAAARYEAAMVANALAIAARATEQGPAMHAAERERLVGFYGTPDATLDELRQRLCGELRRGGMPPERERALRLILADGVRRRLAISNPAYAAKDR